ncbi:MAG: hypothetical protein ACRDJ3_08480 [Solirubrobacteraceae bacterium]
MSPLIANEVALAIGAAVALLLALSLLWRIGAWLVPQSVSLNFDRGLPIGSSAPPVAAQTSDYDVDLGFGGAQRTFLVFALTECKPCQELLSVAHRHPATRSMRLVYLTDRFQEEAYPREWEVYRYVDQTFTRRIWDVQVSPYFYVIDEAGQIVDKGLANRPEHLDRLMGLMPPHLQAARVTFDGA